MHLMVIVLALSLTGSACDSTDPDDSVAQNPVVDSLREAQVQTAEVDIERLHNHLDIYWVMNNRYPETLQDLVSARLVESEHQLLDPWNQTYAYRLDESGAAVVWSLGPDGLPESGDEVHRRPDHAPETPAEIEVSPTTAPTP